MSRNTVINIMWGSNCSSKYKSFQKFFKCNIYEFNAKVGIEERPTVAADCSHDKNGVCCLPQSAVALLFAAAQ